MFKLIVLAVALLATVHCQEGFGGQISQGAFGGQMKGFGGQISQQSGYNPGQGPFQGPFGGQQNFGQGQYNGGLGGFKGPMGQVGQVGGFDKGGFKGPIGGFDKGGYDKTVPF